MFYKIKRIINVFTDNIAVCFYLLIGIIITVNGTYYQKYIDLYSSTEKYFNSYIIFFYNVIPFPGMKLLLILIFFSILIKLLDKNLRPKKISLIIIHLSILTILIGVFISNLFLKEGVLTLKENSEKSNFILNKKYDIIILDMETKIKNKKNFDKNFSFRLEESSIKVESIKYNFEVFKKKRFKKKGFNQNIFRYFIIKNSEGYIENEKNNFSAIIKISDQKINKLILIDKINKFYEINIKNKLIFIKLKNQKHILPFTLKLINFKKDFYIGTDLPKSYESNILIKDKNYIKSFNITLNKPLKYKNYTFYQSSYIEKKKIESVFMISYNNYSIFPYLSCLLLIIGFFIYFFNFNYAKKL